MVQDCLRINQSRYLDIKLQMKSLSIDKGNARRNGPICWTRTRRTANRWSSWRLNLSSNGRLIPSCWIWLKSASSKQICKSRNSTLIFKMMQRKKQLSTSPLKYINFMTKEDNWPQTMTSWAPRTPSFKDSAAHREWNLINIKHISEKMAVVLQRVWLPKSKSCRIFWSSRDKFLMFPKLCRKMPL